MEQDISVRLMMLEIKVDKCIPEEYEGHVRKYLNLMWVVGFDAGRKDVYSRYSKKKTAVIQRDSNGQRIAQYESVAYAVRATKISHDIIFRALKCHKKTMQGHYWEKVT
jgi:hypothetical protein